MIVTVADEGTYLINVTKYMILSLAKYMPEHKCCMVIINGNGKYDNEILKWHPNIFIKHLRFKEGLGQGIYFTFMALPLEDLLEEYNEPLIYLDGDIIIRNSFSKLFDELNTYDILIRYRPYLDFVGPLGSIYGARTNTGVLVLANNKRTHSFVKKFKIQIVEYIKNNISPIAYNEGNTVLTGIDQELIWTLIEKNKHSIKFFPLNDIYNDSYFSKEGIIWHAKGVSRKYPEYLIECYKYGGKDINIVKEYSRLLYRKFKRFSKKLLQRPKRTVDLKSLRKMLNSPNLKKIIIVNSNIFLENEALFKDKYIKCFDSDPVIYYKNKNILINKKINHRYIIYDIETIECDTVDLLICENKNIKIVSNIQYKKKFISV